ncbi:Topoisomerase 1-associated factor 1 [Cryptotrichosporon argae]
MLERYSKTKAFMFVRKRRAARKRRQVQPTTTGEAPIPEEYRDDEDEGVPDREAPSFAEHAFTFESFERRFAQESVVNTLLTYLARFRDFDEPEQMKRVVSLMHRQVVRTQAEGLYFRVSVLHLFRKILDDQASLPADDNTKNLLQLVTFVLRKFFKRVDQDPFVIVEALAPKSGSKWKELSSYKSDDEDGMGGQRARIKEQMGPAELEFVKNKKLSWSQQMGVVVAMLVKADHADWVRWIIEVLEVVLAARREIVLSVDGEIDLRAEDSDGERGVRNFAGPSKAALERFARYDLEADTDERRAAAAGDAHFRLMLKLLSFDVADAAAEQVIWYLPPSVAPTAIETYLGALHQFLATPPAVDDVGALIRKAPRRRARSASPGSDPDAPARPKAPRRKKVAETQVFKSAAFIEDSDDDEAADAAFFAREAAMRAEMERAAEQSGSTMRVTGTKRKRIKDKGRGQGKDKQVEDDGSEADGEDVEIGEQDSPGPSTTQTADADSDVDMDGDGDGAVSGGESEVGMVADAATQRRPRRRIVESDDDA